MVRRCLAGVVPALVLGLGLAPPALAATCTVGDAACPTLREALEAAQQRAGADSVRLPAGAVDGDGAAYSSPDRLDLAGAGARETLVTGALSVSGERVTVRELGLQAGAPVTLTAAGRLRHVRVTGPARGGVAIRAVPGAPLELDDVVIDATGLGAALEARCATVRGRHLTIAGDGEVGARASCAVPDAAASVALDSSVVGPGYPRALVRGERSTTAAGYSNLAGSADGAQIVDAVVGPPGFVSARDLRPAPGSVLIERGNPAPLHVDRPAPGELDSSEPLEDADGGVRIADSDGDGRARRDVGAFEAQAAAFPMPAANVLTNPDAEAGDGTGAPPGWVVTGGFGTEPYGMTFLPTARAGAALGGGARFFSGGDGDGEGPAGEATATQVIDLSGQAASIDTGEARATLSGLVGGYRADADEITVRATFRAPTGTALGTLDLAPVDAGSRGNATNLLARTATAAVPAQTRSAEVTLRAVKASGGAYIDGYADNLGLAFSFPPPPGGGGGGGGDGGGGGPPPPRPFAGIIVLSGAATLSRTTGRAKLLVGCASLTFARCDGDLKLEAALVRRAPRVVVGRARVSLAPGATRRVSVRFSRAARAYLRRHTKLRVRVATDAVDGQGVRRATTVPVTVRPQRPLRRRGQG